MYELAKKARSGMKSKAERLAGEKDRKTDSSDWSPAPELNADVKTGMRPVSRRAYKKGGKVMGCATPVRADRKPRKAGGKVETKGEQPLVDRYINRDLKKANEYRDGKKHVGALKHGGRADKANGGVSTEMSRYTQARGRSLSALADSPVKSGKKTDEKSIKNRMAVNALKSQYDEAERAGRDFDIKDYSGYGIKSKPQLKHGGRAHKNEGGGTPILKKDAGKREKQFKELMRNEDFDASKMSMGQRIAKGAKIAGKALIEPVGTAAAKAADAMGLKKGGRAHKKDVGKIKREHYANGAAVPVDADAISMITNTETGRPISPKEVWGEPDFRDKSGKIPLPPKRPKEFNAPSKAVKPKSKGSTQSDSGDAPSSYGQMLQRKSGGRAEHSDAKEDKALIKKMVKPSAMKEGRSKKADGGPMMMDPRLGIVKNKALEFGQNVVTPGLKKGGRIAKQGGGSLGKMVGALGKGMPNAQAPVTTGFGIGNPVGGGMQKPPGMGGGMPRPNMGRPPMPSPVMGGGMTRPSMPGKGPMQMGPGFPGGPPIGGGIDVPSPRGPNGDFMSTTMPLNPRFGQIAVDQQMIADAQNRGPSIGLTRGPMMGQPPISQSQAMANLGYDMSPMPTDGNPPLYSPIGRKSGGRVARAFGGEINDKSEGKKSRSGKSSVNIVINTGKSDQQGVAPNMPMGSPPAPMPTMSAPPAPPPPATVVGNGMPPMPPPAMGGMPPMPPDGMMPPPDGMTPPMARKSGGRVTKVAKSYKDMEAGAGSGEGRLQKTDIAKRVPKPAFEKGFNPYEGRGYPNKVLGATGGRTARKEGGKVYRSYKDMDVGAGSGKGRMEKTEIQSRKK